MVLVCIDLLLAVVLGLAGSTSAFVQIVRPMHFMVPTQKCRAAVSRVPRAQPSPYAYRALRNMRIMSTMLDVDVQSTDAATKDESISPPEFKLEPETEAMGAPASPVLDLTSQDEAVEAPAILESEEEDVFEDEIDQENGDGSDDNPSLYEKDLGKGPVDKIPLTDIEADREYEGIVTNVVSYGAFVDIGTEVNGLIHISQLSDDFVSNCEDHVNEGDTVRVRVLNVELEERKLVLSTRSKNPPAIQQQGDINTYVKILAEDPSKFLKATVENVLLYGMFVTFEDGCSGFVHVSEMSPTRVTDATTLCKVGDTVDVRIREVDEVLGRINLSLLPLGSVNENASPLVSQRKSKDLSHLEGADPRVFRKGTVSAVVDYGLFVEVDGVDGLLHISKMSLNRTVTPDNIFTKYREGDEVDVRILNINVAQNKMSLSLLPYEEEADFSIFKESTPDQWHDGVVASVLHYGAFVRLESGVDGLVHISHVHPRGLRVNAMSDFVQVGDRVRVRIIEVDDINRKLRLTMREDLCIETGAVRVIDGSNLKPIEAFLDLSPEKWIPATVTSVNSFGAFMSVGADRDGLCHISQITDSHVDRVEDHLAVGQEVEVRVIDVDVENSRLSLSLRAPRPGYPTAMETRGPRKDVSLMVGRDPTQFVTGKVVSIVPYGAFVNVDGVDGLVHISAMMPGHVENVEDVVEVGQEVQVRITDVCTERNTVNMSMLEVDARGESGEGYGGGRPHRRKKTAEDYAREDFVPNEEAYVTDENGADWQDFLNNYFDEKQTLDDKNDGGL